ncbi:hypothetical protein [Pseudomonas sp. URMO17WK12:I4]|uniref:hypothetical protein n=1 Tax=Pseudomonas sp. URMO17WK12:I4 TaxID=1283292 RepID=UPI0004863A39|nr:hypothetical protein [Pseudomonas sp. URMO17WK12:I4]
MNDDTPFEAGPRTVLIQLQAEDLAFAQHLHLRQYMQSRVGLIRLVVLCVVATAGFAGLLRFGGDEALMSVLVFALCSPFAVRGAGLSLSCH